MRNFSPQDCIQYSAQIRFLDNQVCCSYFSCYNAVIHFPLIFTQIMLPWILTTMELESKPNPEFVSNKNNSFLPWCHWSFDSITIWQHKFHMTSGIHSRCSSALGFLTSSHVGSDRKWAVGNDSSQLFWAEQLGCNLGWHKAQKSHFLPGGNVGSPNPQAEAFPDSSCGRWCAQPCWPHSSPGRLCLLRRWTWMSLPGSFTWRKTMV